MTIKLTAGLAFKRYNDFLTTNRLIQSHWHSRDDDGRQLACGLGSLDPSINSPSDCPSSVMPRWLAEMVPWFFDNQEFENAKTWGLAFYAELKRLDGRVPFSVVHDWGATVVGPLNVAICEERKWDASLPLAVQRLHERAVAGDLAPRTEWFKALKPSLKQACLKRAAAYAYADANANADADADADANSDAYAYACANSGFSAANSYAYANRAKIKILADGMVECLRKVPAR
jgi:hypothetical protein